MSSPDTDLQSDVSGPLTDEATGNPGSVTLIGNPVFAGVVITQFLGAFNDNYF